MNERARNSQKNSPKINRGRKTNDQSTTMDKYNQYLLKVEKTGKSIFFGRAYKQKGVEVEPIIEVEGKNHKETMTKLKEACDQLTDKESLTQDDADGSESDSKNEVILSMEDRKNTSLQVKEDHDVIKPEKTIETVPVPVIVENRDGNCLKLLVENHDLLTKDLQKLKQRLDKIQDIVGVIKNEVIPDGLNQNLPSRIHRIIKSNIDEWRREETEKRQTQESLLQDILYKNKAQMKIFDEFLSKFQSQFNDLNSRLDEKIDLQDAHKVLDLRNEIERFVRADVIQSISQKIMPAIEILKDQVEGKDSVIVKSVDEFEQRCKQAGLIPMDKLYP